jgi:hypothetical protein
MKNKAIYFSASLLACVVGFLSFSFSIVACSCAGPAAELEDMAGERIDMDGATASHQIEVGLNLSLSGQRVTIPEFQFFQTYNCKNIASHKIACHIPYKKSLFFVKGFDVTFHTNNQDIFTKASVTPYNGFLP